MSGGEGPEAVLSLLLDIQANSHAAEVAAAQSRTILARQMSLRDADLTGAFAADRPTIETTMGEIADRLTELAREEVERCADRGPYGVPCMLPAGHADLHSSEAPERCSCDESLALRDRLAIAARGTYALHVVKEDGYWTVERWRDGELIESYVGVPTVAEALVRIGEWMR